MWTVENEKGDVPLTVHLLACRPERLLEVPHRRQSALQLLLPCGHPSDLPGLLRGDLPGRRLPGPRTGRSPLHSRSHFNSAVAQLGQIIVLCVQAQIDGVLVAQFALGVGERLARRPQPRVFLALQAADQVPGGRLRGAEGASSLPMDKESTSEGFRARVSLLCQGPSEKGMLAMLCKGCEIEDDLDE